MDNFDNKKLLDTEPPDVSGVLIAFTNPETGILHLKEKELTRVLESGPSDYTKLPVGITAVIGNDGNTSSSLMTSFLIEYYRSGQDGAWLKKLVVEVEKNDKCGRSNGAFPRVWNRKGDIQANGLYLWPEPFLVSEEDGMDEMVIWILYQVGCEKGAGKGMLDQFLVMICSKLVEIVDFDAKQIRFLEACKMVSERMAGDDEKSPFSSILYLLHSPNRLSDLEVKKHLDSRMSSGVATCLPKNWTESMITLPDEGDKNDPPVINRKAINESTAVMLKKIMYKMTNMVLPKMEKENGIERVVRMDTIQEFLKNCIDKLNRKDKVEEQDSLTAKQYGSLKDDINDVAVVDNYESDEDSIFGDLEPPTVTTHNALTREPVKMMESKVFSCDALSSFHQQGKDKCHETLKNASTQTEIEMDRAQMITFKSFNLSEVNSSFTGAAATSSTSDRNDIISVFHLLSQNFILMTCSNTGNILPNESGELYTPAVIGLLKTSKSNPLVYGTEVHTRLEQLTKSWSLNQLILQSTPPDLISTDHGSTYYPVNYESTLGFILRSMKRTSNETFSTAIITVPSSFFQMERASLVEKVKSAGHIAGFSSGAVVNQSALAAYGWMGKLKEKLRDHKGIVKVMIMSEFENALEVAVYRCHLMEGAVKLIARQISPNQVELDTEEEPQVRTTAEVPSTGWKWGKIFSKLTGSEKPPPPTEHNSSARKILRNMITSDDIQEALMGIRSGVASKCCGGAVIILTDSLEWRQLMMEMTLDMAQSKNLEHSVDGNWNMFEGAVLLAEMAARGTVGELKKSFWSSELITWEATGENARSPPVADSELLFMEMDKVEQTSYLESPTAASSPASFHSSSSWSTGEVEESNNPSDLLSRKLLLTNLCDRMRNAVETGRVEFPAPICRTLTLKKIENAEEIANEETCSESAEKRMDRLNDQIKELEKLKLSYSFP